MRIARNIEHNTEAVLKLQSLAIFDNKRGTFPYFTMLLMFKAGMLREAVKYCETSHIKEVADFSKLIARYVECKGSLPREETDAYRKFSAQLDIDVCRQTLISLMIGDRQDSVYKSDLNEIFFA